MSNILWSYLAHFSARSRKVRRIYSEQIPYISVFQEIELVTLRLNYFGTLSKKKAFLILPKMEPYTFKLKLEKLKKYPPLENSLYFRK